MAALGRRALVATGTAPRTMTLPARSARDRSGRLVQPALRNRSAARSSTLFCESDALLRTAA